jgi:O-antigen/teichoic acid export membrane protein
LIYTEAFAEQADTLRVAMLWATLLYVSCMLGIGMTAMRSFRSQFVIGCLNLAVTATASFLLIPVAGLPGAAAALCLGCAVKIVCQLGVIRAQLGGDPA